MKWTFPLGRLAGIAVNAHATFLILLVWIAIASWMEFRSLWAVVAGMGFVLALFGCVVAHELAHALTARRFGIATHDITLLPIGGLSRLARIPTVPSQELWIAAAGPAASLGVAILLALIAVGMAGIRVLTDSNAAEGPFALRLALVNVGLAVFNLLPAFPLDGGRILRALLAMRMDRNRASEIAAGTGQSAALLLGILGLLTNPLLLVIALFIWLGATQELNAARLAVAVRGTTVAAVMRTAFSALMPSDPLDVAQDLSVRNLQRDFPVVDGGRVVGVLTRSDLLNGIRTQPHARVADVMHRQFESVEDSDRLDAVLPRIQGQPAALPVIAQGALVGLIGRDNLVELLQLRAAKSRAAAPQGERPQHHPPLGPTSDSATRRI